VISGIQKNNDLEVTVGNQGEALSFSKKYFRNLYKKYSWGVQQMKSISVLHIRIDEKKSNLSEKILICFISASRIGFAWLFIIFLLENFDLLIGTAESFQFDLTDLLISITGFVFSFFKKISDSYQKSDSR